MPIIIDGKKISNDIRNELKTEVEQLKQRGINPRIRYYISW